ncbi:MAG TPA: C10 family peptidase [Bacteroidales bacterium]|nr:C10 family peptidase [Bacteroidales bacterium]
MKRNLLSFLILLPFIIHGQPVSQADARMVAQHFFDSRKSEPNKRKEPLQFAAITTTFSVSTPLYHTLLLKPKGFIVIAATQNVIPVLAYSYQDNHTGQEVPQGFQFWMNMYSEMIIEAIKKQLPPTPEITEQWNQWLSGERWKEKHIRSTGPLLTSTWNQNRYYNYLCPEDPAGPDGKCYAGCVASAMGQLMFYYRWPITGVGSYSYVHPEYGTLSADYENTTYAWDAMEDHLSNPNLAVAELLYHAGVGVNMDYGPNGSGMYNHSADYVLRTYFKYTAETDYIFKDSTTLAWDSILLDNLNHRRPLYYAGWTADSLINISGHAFVCDGYETEEYFHFNWGWGGSYDGYFYIDNLNPGINFNFGQEVITNLYPDTLNYTYPPPMPDYSHLHTINGTLTDGSGPNFYEPGTIREWLLTPGNENYDSISSLNFSFPQLELTNSEAWIRIYDGAGVNAPLVAEITGNQAPALITTADTAFIIFNAGEMEAAQGWKMRFASTLPVYCSGMTSINDESGVISDGSEEYLYPGNNLCRFWIKEVGSWDNLFLHIDHLNLADPGDKLEILDPSVNPPITLESFTGPIALSDYTINGENNQLFILFQTNGIYNANGVTASFQRSRVGNQPMAIPENISVYPQPASNLLNIQVPEETGNVSKIEIFNTSGKKVRMLLPVNQQSAKISVSSLAEGVYLLKIYAGKSCINKKILIQR